MKTKHALKFGGRDAFTLLDLLASLGVVFLLAAIFLPAVNIARQKTLSTHCLNNLHQLSMGWLMYASANGDRCANNFGEDGMASELSAKTYRTWCLQMEDNTANPNNTNAALLQVGQLAPYVGKDVTHYKCPADYYLSPVQIKAGFVARLRTYSMSGFFGLFSTSTSGDSTYLGKNSFDQNYRQFVKITDTPAPSSMILFLEENAASINDGYYQVGDIPTKWTSTTFGVFSDIPGLYHGGGGAFSFADGHSKIHQWQDASLPPGSIYSIAVGGEYPDKPPFDDIHWIWSHSSTPF